VEKYEVVGQPKKTSDGLIEITILAKVKTNQVVQALKENNLISGEVAGQNLWAEASTKAMNAQDAVAMLEAKIPEWIKTGVTFTPLDKEGKPHFLKDSTGKMIPSTAPAEIHQDPSTEMAELFWAFSIELDRKYYSETIIPALVYCFDAITGTKASQIKTSISSERINPIDDHEEKPDSFGFEYTNISDTYEGDVFKGEELKIIKYFSRTFDSCEYLKYDNAAIKELYWESPNSEINRFREGGVTLEIEIVDKDNHVISSSQTPCWQPFTWDSFSSTNYTSPPTTHPCFIYPTIKIPIHLLKEIKKINVRLVIPKVKISLRKNPKPAKGMRDITEE
jgi:hypothetical protein